MSKFLHENIFLQEELSDVTILVTDGLRKWRFPAHSLVLKCRSSVFRCMLDGEFKENTNGEICITDFGPATVKQLLKYLYLEKLPDQVNDVCELLKIADKYDIASLFTSCENILIGSINVKSVCQLYQFSCLYSFKTLKGELLQLIKRAAFHIIKRDEFENISKDNIVEIISANDLNVENEADVFWAIYQWSTTQVCAQGMTCSAENIGKETGDLLKYVRWKLVDEHLFAKISVTGLMLPEEKDMIDQNVVRVPLDQPSLISFSDFIDLREACKTYKESNDRLRCNFNWISFMSEEDEPIFLIGVQAVFNILNIENCLKFENYATNKSVEATCLNYEKASSQSTVFKIVHFEFTKPLRMGKNEVVTVRPLNSFDTQIAKFEIRNDRKIVSKENKKIMILEKEVFAVKKLYFL